MRLCIQPSLWCIQVDFINTVAIMRKCIRFQKHKYYLHTITVSTIWLFHNRFLRLSKEMNRCRLNIDHQYVIQSERFAAVLREAMTAGIGLIQQLNRCCWNYIRQDPFILSISTLCIRQHKICRRIIELLNTFLTSGWTWYMMTYVHTWCFKKCLLSAKVFNNKWSPRRNRILVKYSLK